MTEDITRNEVSF